MDTARDRGRKSPTPSDDEFYDAYDGSDESDVNDNTPATSRFPCHMPGWGGSRLEDLERREATASGDPASMEDTEGEELEAMTDSSPDTPTLLQSTAQEGNGDLATTTSVSPPAELSSSDKFDSYSTDDSPSSAITQPTSPVRTDDLTFVTASSDITGDDLGPNSASSPRSPSDSAKANDTNAASIPHPKTAAGNSPETASSPPKKVTKKRSRLKWTAAAREVVQADGEDGGFRRSSSSSSISSGSDRRISTTTMLDDIAQVRRRRWSG